ncbi:FAD-binding oxidoreductase [Streptomyces sp. NA02950]|uniref:FAD-dependent oxidoreductase n=1 Tax=Streptomyces sp. NA02950 TaxID=2742137 RepID=UPI001591D592|nr:FAD-dependent oxidoreductase [Streptomyces sp. NA02950]QKV96304.1 FAD-binding oxidoreductase [Streptomyces sp. NA02950]
MHRREVHVVIGAGVAGCLSAITRSRAGYQVVVLERESARSAGTYPVCTQTSNIVSENHSGAEYPFDPRSARDCLDGRIENERFFPELIYGGKTYSRIIASRSMMDDGHDIVGQCRANMRVIQSHYADRRAQDPADAVFGDPADICREIPTVPGVHDVAAAFLTPQRGMNPVLVSTVLDWELRSAGVDFREGSTVTSVTHRADGRYEVAYRGADGTPETVVADQVSLCAATAAFGMAKRLNPSIVFPKLFLALREILYVDLPDGTDKNFTCLKLEDSYGGMLSPLNNACAMIYHPPAAHIMNLVMDPETCAFPDEYVHYLAEGHPEKEKRAEWTLDRLREFYPELRRSTILGTYLKVAINTVSDSRVRRNMGVFDVRPGCTMSVLPKWTMCAVNARKEVTLALEHSVASGRLSADEARELAGHAMRPCLETLPAWAGDPQSITARAAAHAVNMNVPQVLAQRFAPPHAESASSRGTV